jgi:hypothetical protein
VNRVDTHHHMVPPAWLAANGDALRAEIGPLIEVLEGWAPERSIAERTRTALPLPCSR